MNLMFEKAIAFLKSGKKTAFVFDTDGDGIGAAVILAKCVRRAFNNSPKLVPRHHGISLLSKETVNKVMGKFDLVVFLDMAVDEKPEYVFAIAKKSKVVIIDHHQVHKNMNSHKIVHLNSSLWQKKIPSHRYCTSKMVYDLSSNFTEAEDLDWLAALGIINDMAEKSWESFLKEVCDRNRISLEQLKTVNNIITSSYQFSKNKDVMLSFYACLEAISPFDILNGRTENAKKLKGFYDVIEKEIGSIMGTWRERAEILEDKKLIILELGTRFSLSSTISTLVSLEKPDYTVMVKRRSGKDVSISLRRQDKKVDCNRLAKKLIYNLENASGGGHVPAAGIKIMAKDWNVVKKRAQELL
jgi:single-stranded DNA-specific DHH superfamily exonuclease